MTDLRDHLKREAQKLNREVATAQTCQRCRELEEVVPLVERALRIPTLHPEFSGRAKTALDAIRTLWKERASQ
jgi:hypothetical protein